MTGFERTSFGQGDGNNYPDKGKRLSEGEDSGARLKRRRREHGVSDGAPSIADNTRLQQRPDLLRHQQLIELLHQYSESRKSLFIQQSVQLLQQFNELSDLLTNQLNDQIHAIPTQQLYQYIESNELLFYQQSEQLIQQYTESTILALRQQSKQLIQDFNRFNQQYVESSELSFHQQSVDSSNLPHNQQFTHNFSMHPIQNTFEQPALFKPTHSRDVPSSSMAQPMVGSAEQGLSSNSPHPLKSERSAFNPFTWSGALDIPNPNPIVASEPSQLSYQRKEQSSIVFPYGNSTGPIEERPGILREKYLPSSIDISSDNRTNIGRENTKKIFSKIMGHLNLEVTNLNINSNELSTFYSNDYKKLQEMIDKGDSQNVRNCMKEWKNKGNKVQQAYANYFWNFLKKLRDQQRRQSSDHLL
jgi:hypothetical protein